MKDGERLCRRCGEKFHPKPYQWAKSDFECPPCKRARQNKINESRDLGAYSRARFKRPEVKASIRAAYERRKTDPEFILKRKSRRKVGTEIEAGRLERQPCEICGDVKTDAHHADYTKPLDIRWLCRRCHFREEHRADSIAV